MTSASLSHQGLSIVDNGLLNAIGHPLLVTDRHAKLIFANHQAEILLGRNLYDLLKQRLSDLFLEVELRRFNPAVVIDHNSRFWSHSVTISPHDQHNFTARTATLTAKPLCNKSGFPVGQVIEISNVVKTPTSSERVPPKEERYQQIFRVLTEGIVIQDADGRIVECNEQAEAILGWSSAAMQGQTPVAPDWTPIREDGSPFAIATLPMIVTLRTGQAVHNVTMGVRKPDGQIIWILVNTAPIIREGEQMPSAVVTSFTDITGRKRAEEAARDSETVSA